MVGRAARAWSCEKDVNQAKWSDQASQPAERFNRAAAFGFALEFAFGLGRRLMSRMVVLVGEQANADSRAGRRMAAMSFCR